MHFQQPAQGPPADSGLFKNSKYQAQTNIHNES